MVKSEYTAVFVAAVKDGNVEKRRMISVIAVVAVLAAMLAAPVAVFGDETWMFRDDLVKADFPDGEVTECDSMTVDSDEVRNFEKITEAVLDDERGTMVAGIYFIADGSSDGDYYYLSSDSEEADDYYANYGEKAIREMYSNIEDSELVSLTQDGQYMSDWYTFIKVIADVKTGSGIHSEAVYLTAASTDSYTVSKAIVLSPAEGSPLSADDMEDMAKPVIDSFFDYGYDGDMVGESYDDEYTSDDYDSTFDVGNMINTLIAAAALLSAVAAVAAAVKKKRRENSEALSRGNMTAGTSQRQEAVSSASYDSRPAGGRERKGSDRRSSSAKASERTSNKSGHTSVHGTGRAAEQMDRIREKVRSASPAAAKDKAERRSVGYSVSGNDDSGYINSLQTLYKSGLLTKKEMNEMIEKHSKRKGAGE